VSTFLVFWLRLKALYDGGGDHVAARRYRSPRRVPYLTVALASLLLAKKPRTDLPGEPLRTAPAPTHTDDGGELIANDDGTYYCQECGITFDQLPEG
jgi:hypothetical protein